jgi:ribosomal protein L22
VPRRAISFFNRQKDAAAQSSDKAANPVLEEYLRKKPKAPPRPMMGDLGPGSIFEQQDTAKDGSKTSSTTPSPPSPKKEATGPIRDPAAMAAVLDPVPERRQLWERKKVIQEIRKRGRLSKTALLKRTERQSLAKSHNFKTSTKKLGMLARQIAGRSIDDAITQMRFSKKGVAKDVREHLEFAKNQAIVSRGMGLGAAEGTKGEPTTIELKNGKFQRVEDRTQIYIDQAWVGKGPHGIDIEIRARGRRNLLKLPTTSLSVLLKEEATRVRLTREKEEKRRNKSLWVPLPDRPVTAQRPYYCW